MLVLAVGLVAMLLAWRRLAGALVAPLDGATLLSLTATVLAAAVAVRCHGRWTGAACSRRTMAGEMTLSAALGVLLVALIVPGTPVWAASLALAALVAEEAWAWWPARNRPAGLVLEAVAADAFLASPAASPGPQNRTVMPDESVSQQLTRGRAVDGREWIAGWLRVRLSRGQRVAHVHVAFCPPLESVPTARLEPKGSPETQVRAAQVMPYGARFDLKLVEPAEEALDVLLEFHAETEAKQDADRALH
jgi:hypothetical protein